MDVWYFILDAKGVSRIGGMQAKQYEDALEMQKLKNTCEWSLGHSASSMSTNCLAMLLMLFSSIRANSVRLLRYVNLYGPCRTLEEQLDKVQIALEEERDEKCVHLEALANNRQTNRLLMELREERVQRLQDLEEIYAKDKRLEAMTAEMSAATRGISQVNEVIAHKDAELVGLRATAKCSAKLLQVRSTSPQSVFLCANSSTHAAVESGAGFSRHSSGLRKYSAQIAGL
ncbi:hypothetical protein GQ600_27031 [Phytophthora cactorum]|nr:hypothetical protein GQ600_27031 [Phytophthora cactorum]